MTDEQWGEAWKLYRSVRTLPGDQLHALMSQASPDSLVRETVLAMLAPQPPQPSLDRIGQKIGRFVVTGRLGQGGMGEIYAARDLELGRSAAIKILSPLFTAVPGTAPDSRFIQEARAASALNHPNIVTIYEVVQTDSHLCIVMEQVEGRSLRQLCGSPLPADHLMHIGRQIAQALEAAHARGIIHCDIKPENLMVRNDGFVKVLDFGLARDLSIVTSHTALAAGTLRYMAPEQARGEAPSAPSDVFALGLVLYELATGIHPFQSPSLIGLLQAVSQTDPSPPSTANSFIPADLDALILRMLAKAPEQRPTAAAVALQLELRAPGPPVALPASRDSAPVIPKPGRKIPPRSWALPLALASLSGILALAFFYWPGRPAPESVRFSVTPPVNAPAVSLAVSPDGRKLVFADSNAIQGLWLRAFNSLELQLLPGTKQALSPSWSPDGHSLVFVTWAEGLRRLDLGQGASPPRTLAAVANNYSGTDWGSRDIILYQPLGTGVGLSQIPAGGGTPSPATVLNQARGDIAHRYPQFLPDGRHFIYWVWSLKPENTGIYIGSLDAKERVPETPLVTTWREGRYALSGHLLYLQGGTLLARRFDPVTLTLSGDPYPLPDHINRHPESTGRAIYSVGGGNSLAYQEALSPPRPNIVTVNRAGRIVATVPAPPGANWLALDPAGKRLVFHAEDENTLEELWTLDLARNVTAPLAGTPASNQRPTWSPDGKRIAFHSNRTGSYDIYARNADGTGADELLLHTPYVKTAETWSPDGKFLLYSDSGPESHGIWALPLVGERKPFPVVLSPSSHISPRFSPVPDQQGRYWFSYISNKTGTFDVYYRPFQPSGPAATSVGEIRISSGGGWGSCWRSDGSELFYSQPLPSEREATSARMMAVTVRHTSPPQLGTPRPLFDVPLGLTSVCTVSPDGQKFTWVEPVRNFGTATINVVLNWLPGLSK